MKTKYPRPATLAKAQAGIRAAYLSTFNCQSCDPKWDAQRNLQGRTHYVDESTLRGFESRILATGHSTDGMLFWLIESVNSRPNHSGRNKRFVAFDLWGTVVNDRAGSDDAGWHRTSEAAYKAGEAWAAGFDSAAHTLATLKERAKHDIDHARRILAALKAPVKPATV